MSSFIDAVHGSLVVPSDATLPAGLALILAAVNLIMFAPASVDPAGAHEDGAAITYPGTPSSVAARILFVARDLLGGAFIQRVRRCSGAV